MTAQIDSKPAEENKVSESKEKPYLLFGTFPFEQSFDGVSTLESLLDLFDLVATKETANASTTPLLLNITRVLRSLNYESSDESNAKESSLARLKTFLLSQLKREGLSPALRSELVAIFAQVRVCSQSTDAHRWKIYTLSIA